MVPETMVELLAARFTQYHSSLVAGLLLGLALDLPCRALPVIHVWALPVTPDHSVFTPNGDFVRTDSNRYATDFAVGFARAPVWPKAQLGEDYIGMEISRIDTQMILMLARRKEVEAICDRVEKDYRQWLVQRQALEQSYRDVARISQDIVDLRAKTGPNGRASRGLSAQCAVNRFILVTGKART
jgi:hypothetical protein